MMEALSVLAGLSNSISIVTGGLHLLEFVRGITGSDIISALFDVDGKRTSGSEQIEVAKIPGHDESIWWYAVKPVPDYIFTRMALIPSCVQEIAGRVAGEKNPDATYWRWIAMERQGMITDSSQSPPNIRVSFLIIGYKPQALIKHFSS
jgi:hypothetical protein